MNPSPITEFMLELRDTRCFCADKQSDSDDDAEASSNKTSDRSNKRNNRRDKKRRRWPHESIPAPWRRRRRGGVKRPSGIEVKPGGEDGADSITSEEDSDGTKLELLKKGSVVDLDADDDLKASERVTFLDPTSV
jgi:hypothetical protein